MAGIVDPFAQCDGEETCSGDPFGSPTGDAFAQCEGEETCIVDPDNVFGVSEVLSAFGMCDGDDIGLEGLKMEEDPTYTPDIYSESVAAYCDGYTDPTISEAVTALSGYQYPLVIKLTDSRALMMAYKMTSPTGIYLFLLDIAGLGVSIVDSVYVYDMNTDALRYAINCRLSDTVAIIKSYASFMLVIDASGDALTVTRNTLSYIRLPFIVQPIRLDDNHFMHLLSLESSTDNGGYEMAFYAVYDGLITLVNAYVIIPIGKSVGIPTAVMVNAFMLTVHYYENVSGTLKHILTTFYLDSDYSVASARSSVRANFIDDDWISSFAGSLIKCSHPFYYLLGGSASTKGLYSFKVVNADALVSLQGKPAWITYPYRGALHAYMALNSNAVEPPVLAVYRQTYALPSLSYLSHRLVIFQGWTSHSATIDPLDPSSRGQDLYSYEFAYEMDQTATFDIDRVIEIGLGSLLIFYVVFDGTKYNIKYKRISNLRV